MSESAQTRPLRIAMTSYYLPSSSKIGVGYQVHAFANALVDRDHEVTVYSGCGPCDGARYRTVTVALPRRLRTFGFARSIKRLDLSGYDVLHAHGDDYWLWSRRVPAHVRTMHGSCFEEALRVPGAKERLRMVALGVTETLSTLVADRTVLVSPQTRRWLPWVHQVIPNGVPPFPPVPREQRAKEPTILFVGTYRNRKRGRLLMDVFADTVRPALPDARLVMVCEDAPAAPGVTVTGRVNDATLAQLYARAWVFCLPSTYEGFGIPYAEALSAGLPVIATPNPGARFVLGDSAAGAIVNETELGSVLIDLLRDPVRRDSMSGAARQRASVFDMTSVVESYETIYRELLARSRTPRDRSGTRS